MSSSGVDGAVCDRARAAIVAARAAEHEVLVAVTELETAGVAAAGGYPSLESMLIDLWRVDRSEARRLIRAARALTVGVEVSGAERPPSSPAAAVAAQAGTLDRGHLQVIDDALRHLREVPGLAAGDLGEAEAFLVAHAANLPPAGLRRLAAAVVARLDPDGVAPDEPDPERGAGEVHLVRRRDGTLKITARFTRATDIDTIAEAFDALSGRAGPHDTRDLPERHAETLLDLCAHATDPGTDPGTGTDADPGTDADADAGTDPEAEAEAEMGVPEPRDGQDAPRSGTVLRAPGRAVFGVSMPLEWLHENTGHALLDTGEPISPAEARRLACDAQIVPLVLGTRSEPLDLGRASYTVSAAQRRALVWRDRGCTFPGCTRRPRRCQAHHIVFWTDHHGPTDLDNLTLLCRHHHRVIHHEQWTITMIRGRPWYTPPTWIDPHRQPRPGGTHAA